MPRLFLAVWPPEDTVSELMALRRKDQRGVRFVAPERWHVTLRFFGELAEPVAEDLDSELEAATSHFKPFEVKLKGAGSFGGVEPHALWIGAAENASLTQLAAACEKAARRVKLKPEPHKFTPHVTLAYLNGATLDRVQRFEQEMALFEAPPFRVESFGLYSSVTRKSAPSLYRLEAEYPLLG
mgnify:CR=1 FL=1